MTPRQNTCTATSSTAAAPPPTKIPWIVRPATLEDKDSVDALLQTSYQHLLVQDYPADLLQKALPRICSARPELLTSSTWYVAEHPETGALVGCGGWTPQSPFHDDTPHLRHFATHPDYTRQGIARALWNKTWKDWCEYYDDHHHRHRHHHHCATKNQNQNDDTDNDKQEQEQPTPPRRRRPDMEVFSTLTAESFYASLGFQKIKEIIIPLSEDCSFPSILMRRPDAPSLSSLSSSPPPPSSSSSSQQQQQE